MLPLPWWGSCLTLEPSGLHITISGLLWAPFPTHPPFPLHPHRFHLLVSLSICPPSCDVFLTPPPDNSSLPPPHTGFHPTLIYMEADACFDKRSGSWRAVKDQGSQFFFQLLMSSHAFQEIVLYFTFLLCYTLYVLHYLCNQNITLLTRS